MFDAEQLPPDIRATWWPRIEAAVAEIVHWEANRAGKVERREAEIEASATQVGLTGVTLTGRADRMDRRSGDGAVDIIDFKTGTPPSARQVLVGFAPQLGLEAAMVRRGAFDSAEDARAFTGRSIANLGWIALGQVERGQPVRSAVERDWTADDVADETYTRLLALVSAFDDPDHGYASRARPMFETRYESPYDHLARVREWALVESDEDIEWLPPRKP